TFGEDSPPRHRVFECEPFHPLCVPRPREDGATHGLPFASDLQRSKSQVLTVTGENNRILHRRRLRQCLHQSRTDDRIPRPSTNRVSNEGDVIRFYCEVTAVEADDGTVASVYSPHGLTAQLETLQEMLPI